MLFERGIDICHETVRFWWNRFGQDRGNLDILRQLNYTVRGVVSGWMICRKDALRATGLSNEYSSSICMDHRPKPKSVQPGPVGTTRHTWKLPA